jgi:uncharacterized protein YjdB/alpha-L-arabinofuranosidase
MKNHIRKILVVFALIAIQTNVNSQVQVTVTPSSVLTDISQDPLGLCLSYPNDDDEFFPDRNRSTVEAFNSLNVKTLRFPMGTLADNYFWHEPGDYQNAVNGLKPHVASMVKNPGSWDWLVNADGSIKASALDFDEYIDLCNSTGSEPVIMVNAFGHLHEGSTYSYQDIKTNAVEWVRYANVVKNLNIKYWEIGNELSVEVNHGKITPAEYVTLFLDFTAAMKVVDPSIKVGLGLGFNHFDDVLSQTYEKADFIVPHNYSSQYDNFDDYRSSSSAPLLNHIANANNAINNVPEPYRSNIGIMVTEFSSFRPGGNWKTPAGTNDNKNDIGKSMVTFEMLASALSSFDRISYMHFWVTHSPFGSSGFSNSYTNAFDEYLNTLNQGNAIALFNRFKRDKMVETTSSSSLVRVYASYSENAEDLTVYLINKSYTEEIVTIEVNSQMELKAGDIWTYTGENGQANDIVSTISKTGSVVPQQNSYTVTLPPVSITAIARALSPLSTAYFIDNVQENQGIKSNQSATDVEITDNGIGEWGIVQAGSGYVYLQSLTNGKKLQGTSSDLYLESAVSLAPSTSTDDWVKWKITKSSPGVFFIDNKAHNVRLFLNGSNEVSFGSTSWTGSLVQWKIANYNSEPPVLLFNPDLSKTYFMVSPTHNLKIGANGGEDAFTTTVSATDETVQWKFTESSNPGYFHIDCIGAGSTPRIRTDDTENADMQDIGSEGVWTQWLLEEVSDTEYFTLTTRDGAYTRLEVDSNGSVKMNKLSDTGTYNYIVFEEGYPLIISVTGITSTPSLATLYEGESIQVTASLTPADASNQNVTWSSDNTSVATVDTDGLVTVVGVGVANIIVTTDDGGFSDTSEVTVVCNTLPSVDPYLQINDSTWQNVSTANLNEGDTIKFAPSPSVSDTWEWTGPNGYIANTREITISNVTVKDAGDYIATCTTDFGCSNSVTFNISVELVVYFIVHVGTNLRMQSNSGDSDAISTETTTIDNRAKWELRDAGNEYYYIICEGNGKKLEALDANLDNGSSITLTDDSISTNSVKWRLIPEGSHYFIDNVGYSNRRLSLNEDNEISLESTTLVDEGVQWKITDSVTMSDSVILNIEHMIIERPIINVYPNPASDRVFLSTKGIEGKANLKLYNIMGQQLMNQTFEARENNINTLPVNELTGGIYMIKISSESGHSTIEKLMIK